MTNIMKELLYKIRKNSVFHYTIFFFLLIAIATSFTKIFVGDSLKTMNQFMQAYGYEMMVYSTLFSVMLVGIFVGHDFANKTINYEVMKGYSRTQMLISRCVLLPFIVFAVCVIFNLGICLCVACFLKTNITGEVFVFILLSALIYSVFSLITIVSTVVSQNAFVGISITLFIIIVEIVISSITTNEYMTYIFSVFQLKSMIVKMNFQLILCVLCSKLVDVVIAVIGAKYVFETKDLC